MRTVSWAEVDSRLRVGRLHLLGGDGPEERERIPNLNIKVASYEHSIG